MDNFLFGLEERHVAGNPKQKDLRRGDRLFLWKNPCLIKENHGLIKKVWEGFGKLEEM